MKPTQLAGILFCVLNQFLVDGFARKSINAKSTSVCPLGGVTSLEWTAPNGNVFLHVGTPLEIYCALDANNPTTKGYAAKDIVFKRGSAIIDSKYVTVLNKTTARLYMDDLPVSAETEYFKCTLSQPSKTRGGGGGGAGAGEEISPDIVSPEYAICSNGVLIGSKPRQVSNFSCYNYNWASLNCSWNEPNNGIETNYSIYYSIPRKSKKTPALYECAIRGKENCAWTTGTTPMYRPFFKHLYFQIDGVNRFGNASQTIKFDNFERAISAPPTEITPLSKTPRSVHLQWNLGMWVIFDMDLDYIVEYARNSTSTSASASASASTSSTRHQHRHRDWITKRYRGDQLDRYKDTVRANVTDFPYPNVAYHVRVYMKSPLAGEDCWSQPASAVVKTSPCAPYVSPDTDVGGFQVHREHGHHRDVAIYWKQIPQLERNGDYLRYDVVVWENNVRVNVRPDFIGDSYANFTNLSFRSYEFHITSVNEIGSAPYSSVVHLPDKRDTLPKAISFAKTDTADGGYHLSWQLPNFDRGKIANITIFWCETNGEFSHVISCPGLVNWTHLNPGTFEYDFPAADPSIGLEFAISLNSQTSSSGMKWASCGNFRKRQISRIRYIWPEVIGPSFVEIRWKLECAEKMDAIIKGFNITYCAVNATATSTSTDRKCVESEKTVAVYGNATLNRANITDLYKSSRYKISLFAFTETANGPRSVEICTQTRDDKPKPDEKFAPIVEINGNELPADVKKYDYVSSNDPLRDNEVYK